ncbi:plasmid mobilization protein [Lachnospiraceae bacterium C1.1]|nr:hypothetical protein [Lachnospiraceae bacterium]MDN4744590.1 hypothetical protein [Lachnospiraceae bacterium C1.1]
MPCKREARLRHNTIAFWLSDEEKAVVDARIKAAGIPKGEYYRSSILGQKVEIVAGKYRSDRLAIVLEKILARYEGGDADAGDELREVLYELLELIKR